jgi:hypothetical protein
MANLITLTVAEDSKLVNAGSFSFNIKYVKKLYANGTGAVIYYVDSNDSSAKITKLKVSQSTTTINAALTGTRDMQIPLNILEIDGTSNVRTENINVANILYCQADTINTNYSFITLLDRSTYKVNHAISAIETLANNYTASGGGGTITNIDFNPATGIALNNITGTFYNLYAQSGDLDLTIASGSVEAGKAKLIIEADGNDFSVTGATQNPKSDTFDTTIGNRNLIEFEVITGIVFYNITCLDI